MRADVVLVPYHLAARRAGMGQGPEAVVAAGALADLDATITTIEAALPDDEPAACFHLDALIAERLGRGARDALRIVIAGNCHTAVGTIAAVAPDAAVWFDAHGDLNAPETSASGFFDGTALAAAAGRAWMPLAAAVPGFRPLTDGAVLLVGGRDLDPPERQFLATGTMPWHQPPSRRSDGHTAAAFERALRSLRTHRRVYVHIDLDVLDPSVLNANPYAHADGVSVEWLEAALAAIGRHHDIAAVAFTAFDPACDSAVRASAIVRRLIRAIAAR